MRIIKRLNTPFFLTGGTALSRHYFHHRYSDVLDLFTNADPRYQEYVETILGELFRCESALQIQIDRTSLRRLKDFTQVFIHPSSNSDIILKIDMVNDIAVHYGENEMDETLGVIDSWRNILSNKISALFRFEPKDVADIWMIAKKKPFAWNTLITEAKNKEAGVEPEIIYNILRSFPIDQFDIVRWVSSPEKNEIRNELIMIADDIFYGRKNSLCE